jgi:predicted transporter
MFLVDVEKNTGIVDPYPCPCCGNKSKLSIIGLRSATAVSAVISELYASRTCILEEYAGE